MQSYQAIPKAFNLASLLRMVGCCATMMTCVTIAQAQSGSRDTRLSLPGDSVLIDSTGSQTGAGAATQSQTPLYNGSTDVVYSSGPVYSGGEGGAYSAGGSTYSGYLGAHMRARYNTRSYGQTRGNLDLGTAKFYDDGNGVWFADGQVTMNDDAGMGYNVGLGYRFLTLPLLPGSFDKEKIAGISVWSDGNATINDNFFTQVGVSLEYLGENWDMRSNISVPLEDTKYGSFTETGELTFAGNFLARETIAGVDEALGVAEFELARRLLDLDAWAFADVYSLYGENTDTVGAKVGVRGYVLPDLSLSMAIAEDDVFGTNAVFNMTWFIGRTRGNVSNCSWAYQRLREPVLRNDYIAIAQSTIRGGNTVTGDVNGDGTSEQIGIVHVDSTAAEGGDGSFESPLNELDDVFDNSTGNSIVLVHGGSNFDQDNAVLRDGQRLLGEGGGINHTVAVDGLGTVSLPETAPGARDGAIPTVTNTMGDVITLGTRTAEVSNFSINGGDRAIVSPMGTTGANLNNLQIANTTGNGIELTPASTLTTPGDEDTRRVDFSPNISNVTFSNVGGDDINMNADAGLAATVPVTENIVISDVTSTGGQGIGINLSGNSSVATISDYSHDGGNASAGGVLITDATGAVSMADATIRNQGGFGVRFANNTNAAAHNLNNVTIEETANTAFDIVGGTADIDFTGSITQSQNATTVAVSDGHTGTVNFFESVANAGVVNATNGDGLQFNNADGDYTFAGGVTLNGGDAGIDMIGDTDGTITLTEATITNPTGTAVNIDGGNGSLTYTGSITQNNAVTTLNVQNHSSDAGEGNATVDFNGVNGADVITANNGLGLQFNNADGTYRFNDGVVMDGSANGADTALDIIGDSSGTFTFDDATITDPTGTAITVAGGSANLNYTGTVTQSNNQDALEVSGGHNGTMVFVAGTAGGNVISATNGDGLQFNNADGDYSFNDGVVLNGGNAGIDIVADSDGTFTFDEARVTNPSGVAFNVVGGSADVTLTGEIAQANSQDVVSISGGHDGTIMFNEIDAGDGSVIATNGNGIQFDNADGAYFFNDGVMLNGGNAGIDIVNDSSGSMFFDTDSEITNPTGDAFVSTGGSADVTYLGTITDNTGHAVMITGNTGGGASFGGLVTSTDEGIHIEGNTGGDYAFNGGLDLDTGVNDAVTLATNSGTTISFQNMDISTTTGNGFTANGTEVLTATGTGNTITATTGTGLTLNNSTIGAGGFRLDSVSVDGAVNGIVIENVTGGAINIGSGAVVGSGGNILNTTGAGVLLTNVENVSLNRLNIDGTGADGVTLLHNDTNAFGVSITDSVVRNTTGDGIQQTAEGSGPVTITLDGNIVDNTGLDSIDLSVEGNASLADITIRDNVVVNSSNRHAMRLVGTGGTLKVVNLLMEGNTISNNDPAMSAALLNANGTVNLNATINSNNFANTDVVSGAPFTIGSNNASAQVRLTMTGNTAAASNGGSDYFLNLNAGTFSVENLNTAPTIEDNNTGDFVFTPNKAAFTEDAGGIPTP